MIERTLESASSKALKNLALFFIVILLGSVSVKVIQNFFFGGPPAQWQGGTVGFSNYVAPVGAAYSYLPHTKDWTDCLIAATEFLEQSELIEEKPSEHGFVSGRIDNDLVVFSCNDKSLNIFVASTDYRRASVLRHRIVTDFKKNYQAVLAPDQ